RLQFFGERKPDRFCLPVTVEPPKIRVNSQNGIRGRPRRSKFFQRGLKVLKQLETDFLSAVAGRMRRRVTNRPKRPSMRVFRAYFFNPFSIICHEIAHSARFAVES